MKSIKKSLLLLAPLFLLVGCANPIVNADAYTTDEEGNTHYSIAADRVAYRMDKVLDKCVNTFEAWIRLPKDLADEVPGGVITGNYFCPNGGYPGCVNFMIGRKGQFELIWNWKKLIQSVKAEFEYTHLFENYDFRTGNWEHIALVRDDANGTLTLYVNGVLNEQITDLHISDATTKMPFQIGMDYSNWFIDYYDKMQSPFMGDIKQVTMYSESQTLATINADRASKVIEEKNRNGLIANYYLLDKDDKDVWGKVDTIKDNSRENGIGLTYKNFNRYVDMKDYGEYDYSFAVIPDMQAMNNNRNKRYLWTEQSEYLVNHKDDLKLKFAIYVGDMTEHKFAKSEDDAALSVDEWKFAQKTMRLLDGKLPYNFVLGNHDYDTWMQSNRDTVNYNTYMPYSYYFNNQAFPYMAGAFEEGKMDNYYTKIEVENIKYMIFSLEYRPRNIVMNWVDRMISENPDYRVIVSTHSYLIPACEMDTTVSQCDDGWNSVSVWEKTLKKHPNLFAIFGGHHCTDEIVWRRDKGTFGNDVLSVLVDLQGSMLTSCMNTFLLVKVNETTKKMALQFYSPEYDACFLEQNQFVIDFSNINNPVVKEGK